MRTSPDIGKRPNNPKYLFLPVFALDKKVQIHRWIQLEPLQMRSQLSSFPAPERSKEPVFSCLARACVASLELPTAFRQRGDVVTGQKHGSTCLRVTIDAGAMISGVRDRVRKKLQPKA